jgi:hypothetical protein
VGLPIGTPAGALLRGGLDSIRQCPHDNTGSAPGSIYDPESGDGDLPVAHSRKGTSADGQPNEPNLSPHDPFVKTKPEEDVSAVQLAQTPEDSLLGHSGQHAAAEGSREALSALVALEELTQLTRDQSNPADDAVQLMSRLTLGPSPSRSSPG